MGRHTLRRVSGVEIRPAHAFNLLGQELQQHAAGAPAVMWAVAAGPHLFGHGKSHLGGDLFGAQEVFMCGLFEAAARKGDETLVAVHVRPLINRHGKMAAAQKIAGRYAPSLPSPACGGGEGGGPSGQKPPVETGARPYLSRPRVIT